MRYGLIFIGLWFGLSCVSAGEPVYLRSDVGQAVRSENLPEKLDLASNLIWKAELDSGHSTPIIVGDRIFLTTYDADTEALATIALEKSSGKTIWSKQAPKSKIESVHQVGNPAAATPASDGERVYSFFGSYGLLCYDLDGEEIWSRPMGPFQDEFGAASSPIVKDGIVLLNEDHDANNFLYAFDSETGSELWKAPRDEFTRSYSTPMIFNNGGEPQVLVAGALRLTAYDLKGKPIWWVDGLARIVNPIAAASEGKVFMATWAPGGDVGARIGMQAWEDATKELDKNSDNRITFDELPEGNPVISRFYRMDMNQDKGLDQSEWERHAAVFEKARNSIIAIEPKDAKGNLTDTNVLWTYDRGIPYVATPLVVGDTLFMVKDGGILTSLNKTTGKVGKQGRLSGRGNYYSSPVFGDGKIYIASERGVLSIVTAEREWTKISSIDFGEGIYATPVILDNRIYLRTEKALYCFGI